MSLETSKQPTSININDVDLKEGIDSLVLAERTMSQVVALLQSIEQSNSLEHAQKLACIGGSFAADMANCFDCAADELKGARTCA